MISVDDVIEEIKQNFNYLKVEKFSDSTVRVTSPFSFNSLDEIPNFYIVKSENDYLITDNGSILKILSFNFENTCQSLKHMISNGLKKLGVSFENNILFSKAANNEEIAKGFKNILMAMLFVESCIEVSHG